MQITRKHFMPLLFIFLTCTLLDLWVFTEQADARSRAGGRSFSRSRSVSPSPARTPSSPNHNQGTGSGGFMRGMAGGLVGGAIGGLLFGSLANAGSGAGIGGSGIGIFQILVLGGIGYFVYARFLKKKTLSQAPGATTGAFFDSGSSGYFASAPHPGGGSVAEGIAMIRRSEPDFDPEHFKEVAQDVFFQVQAGWMRRDIKSYQHLLDSRLAQEYEEHFVEMRRQGHINKLENIAVRSVALVDAGVDNSEEFVTLLFTANLLDYTVDEKSGAVVEGSISTPVKFAEKWTWARPLGASNWQLAGVAPDAH